MIVWILGLEACGKTTLIHNMFPNMQEIKKRIYKSDNWIIDLDYGRYFGKKEKLRESIRDLSKNNNFICEHVFYPNVPLIYQFKDDEQILIHLVINPSIALKRYIKRGGSMRRSNPNIQEFIDESASHYNIFERTKRLNLAKCYKINVNDITKEKLKDKVCNIIGL
jgi:hypothetical protein